MLKRLFFKRSRTAVYTRSTRQDHKYLVLPQPGLEPLETAVQDEGQIRETDSVTSLSLSGRLLLSGGAPQYIQFQLLDKYIQCQIEQALRLTPSQMALPALGLSTLLVENHNIVQPSNFSRLALVNMESDRLAMDQILPNKSILVYAPPNRNVMMLMAVNLTSAQKYIHTLTVTVSNGGLPIVKFTPHTGGEAPWDAPKSGQIFSRQPNGGYENTKLVTTVEGGDSYALKKSDEPFLLGDTTFAALTATKWDAEKNPHNGSDFSFNTGLIPQHGAC